MRWLPRLIVMGLLMGVSPANGQTPDFASYEIADGVYQFRYRIHYSFFVVTPVGVVAFDPISADAVPHYAREIRRLAPDQPLLAIVYSHDHWDHVTGADLLRAEFEGPIPIIAHENAYAHIQESDRPGLVLPDVTFADALSLRYGGRSIELKYLGSNHGDSIVIAWLPAEKVVFAVDFVSNDGIGFRDIDSYVFPDYFDSIRRLQALDYETIVFGHYWPPNCRECMREIIPARPGDRQTIERQLAYYEALRDAVSDAMDRGLSEDEAAAEVRMPSYEAWGGYHEWIEGNVRGVYRWLAGQPPQ